MDDPLSLFKQYENEYCSLSTNVASGIKQVDNLGGEMRASKLYEVEAKFRQAEGAFKKLQQESRALSPTLSAQVQGRVKEYSLDIKKLKTDLLNVKQSTPQGDAARAAMGLDGMSEQSKQRQQMLDSTQLLNKTGDKIRHGQAMLNEAEETGVGILQDLHGQRERLIHARDTLHSTDDNISRARKILSNMSRRIFTQKAIMLCVILVLICVIILVVYFKLVKKH
eukprot:TRINITY_DN21588_c0_g1_i13.p1 TRINITY_DN21588_c0_g1~~TRINITY_DN21588_c0_g1_i13.p1  ORF type:complete len:224 (-),score=26.43 TRINITY_DN21588_c0_g1_i13:473-1144(-)